MDTQNGTRTNQEDQSFIIYDAILVTISIAAALLLVKSGILASALHVFAGLSFIGSFIAGIFFTSVFTTAPAIVSLGEIAQSTSTLQTALWGACGAVIGDLIIFMFIQHRFHSHTPQIAGHHTFLKRMRVLVRLKYGRWLTVMIAGMLIASPLPSELGVGLLSFSRISMSWFLPLSFAFNFVGILFIGAVANAI